MLRSGETGLSLAGQFVWNHGDAMACARPHRRKSAPSVGPPLPDDCLQTWTVVLTSDVGMSAPRRDAGAVSIGDRLALPGNDGSIVTC
jgi:hypothetical protein